MVIPIVGAAAAVPGFVGRDRELDQLLELLGPAARQNEKAASSGAVGSIVVSAVAGLAGVGKTALAWQAARRAVGRGWFPGGAMFIDLHGYDSDPTARVVPERVFASLLRGLGVPAEDVPADVDAQASAYQQILVQLANRQLPVLLVADNTSTVAQVTSLLPHSGGGHRVLVTSRHTLGELPNAAHLDLAILDPLQAVQLLATAITTHRPVDLRVLQDPKAAAELARLCGYLPLALQIIAAILVEDPALPLRDLAGELAEENSRLEPLAYGSLAVRVAFDLSYQRLDATQARVLRLMSVPPGTDISTEATSALIDQPAGPIRRTLARLARAHLLDQYQSERWRMHDLV